MTNSNTKGSVLAVAMLAATLGHAQTISVSVDGDPVQFRGQGPVYRNGRVLVPLRGVFENMGATVNWRPNSQTVIARRGDRNVRLRIGDRSAMIDGNSTRLDVPAMIINGSTMVPIRFLGESLGADVAWNADDRLVAISANDNGRAQTIDRGQDRWSNPRRNNGNWGNHANRDRQRETTVISRDTVLPVELDTRLSSNESRSGDKFTATVRTGNDTYYGMLPAGTRVEGEVLAARPRQGNDPGVLELDFQRLRLPNGRAYQIDGTLISLEGDAVTRDDNGRIRAAKANTRDNRTVYAGYGAGAGLIVGLLTKKPLESTILGGILGYLAGEAQRGQNKPADVRLNPGTEFGVRLSQDVALQARDIR